MRIPRHRLDSLETYPKNDDLVLTAEPKEAVEEMLDAWSSATELRSLKVNIGKSNLLVSRKNNEAPASSGQHLCAICNRRVGVNSIVCSRCSKWCPGRCTGLSSFKRVVAKFGLFLFTNQSF